MTASLLTVSKTEPDTTLPQWQPATWEDYLACCDDPEINWVSIYFNRGHLLVDMSNEGISHATITQLFTMLFAFWFSQKPELIFTLMGGCLLEKANTQAASPDLVLYLGEDYPRRLPGERRYVNLNRCRVPNLVGEISDTTLASDLDEKKQIYADLQIPEYWVIDVRALRVLAFQLQSNGKYQECSQSLALSGLQISLLEQTLERLNEGTNGSAALWFAQQIANRPLP
jgi:Uma2 family endonuclease